MPINIFEDGKESRDFVYIDDVVNATIAGIEKPEADGEVFNVGSGVSTTVLNVAETLIKNYGADVPLQVTGSYRLGDIRHNYANINKIERALGFKPLMSFADGIKKFTDWVNSQAIQQSRYDESIKEMKQKGLMK